MALLSLKCQTFLQSLYFCSIRSSPIRLIIIFTICHLTYIFLLCKILVVFYIWVFYQYRWMFPLYETLVIWIIWNLNYRCFAWDLYTSYIAYSKQLIVMLNRINIRIPKLRIEVFSILNLGYFCSMRP